MDQQIDECGDGDDEYYEDDVEWHTLVTVMTSWKNQHTQWVLRQMTQNLLEQFDGNLEDADEPASHVYASATRSFQEARELLFRVKSARGYFPAVSSGTG